MYLDIGSLLIGFAVGISFIGWITLLGIQPSRITPVVKCVNGIFSKKVIQKEEVDEDDIASQLDRLINYTGEVEDGK